MAKRKKPPSDPSDLVPAKYLRKAQVRHRYGDISDRAVEKYVATGRLPKPVFLFNRHTPFWSVEALDQNDRRLEAQKQA
jgi:hypothetical protein